MIFCDMYDVIFSVCVNTRSLRQPNIHIREYVNPSNVFNLRTVHDFTSVRSRSQTALRGRAIAKSWTLIATLLNSFAVAWLTSALIVLAHLPGFSLNLRFQKIPNSKPRW